MMTGTTPGRLPEIHRLLDRIRGDGIPLPADTVLDAVEAPHWDAARTRHDWRNHVPPSVRRAWPSLPLEARLHIFETAELAALDEEPEFAMLTG